MNLTKKQKNRNNMKNSLKSTNRMSKFNPKNAEMLKPISKI